MLEKVPKSNYYYDGDVFLLELLDTPAKSKPSATQKIIVAQNTAVDEPVGGGEREGGEHGEDERIDG